MNSDINKFRQYKYGQKPQGPKNISVKAIAPESVNRLIIAVCLLAYGFIFVFVGLVLGGWLEI